MVDVANCTDPSASDLFRYEIPENPALIGVLTLCTIITLVEWIVFIRAAHFVHKNLPYRERAMRNIWILAIYPVYCFTSLLALYVPKVALLSTIAANFYFFPCLYHYFQLMLDYFGGLDAMVQKCKNQRITYWRPPLCCWCMPCGQRAEKRGEPHWTVMKVTRRNVLVLELFVMQIAIFRPAVLFLTQMLKLDGSFDLGVTNTDTPFLYLTIITVVTTMSAMTALTILYKGLRDHLPHYNVVAKFLCTQVALILANLQPGVMLVLVSTGVIKCQTDDFKPTLFPHTYRGEQWHSFLMICESVFLFPLMLKYFRNLKGNLLYIPGSIKKVRSYGGISNKTMEEDMLSGEKQPLMKRTRSGSSISEYFGTVETV